jgi:hypothetical protein
MGHTRYYKKFIKVYDQNTYGKVVEEGSEVAME